MNENSKKINILHLRDSPWLDGPGRTILETAASIDISQYNYLIGAFCSKSFDEHPFINAAIERKLNIYPIVESGSFDPRAVSQILEVINKHQVNILHTHEVRSDFIGLFCGKLKRIPVVTTIHGWIENGIKGKMYTALDKCILGFFDHIITVSEEMKKRLLRIGIADKKISVLHNALVLETYGRASDDQNFKQEIGVSDGTILIGNIGRLSPEKGQSDFIIAAREVLRHHDNVKFIIIGTGPDQANLERIARDLKIQESVIFAGFRTDMPNVYKGLDLVVQSSYTEGMPNVVLEALLMEVPVIATNVGGTSEAIKNNQTGILIPPRAPEEIKNKTLEYLQNPDRFIQMAKKGKFLIERKFNFRDRTKKLALIYRQLIQTR